MMDFSNNLPPLINLLQDNITLNNRETTSNTGYSSSTNTNRSSSPTNAKKKIEPKVTGIQKKNNKVYICKRTNCNATFTTSGHLARHDRIHTGEKNYKCLLPSCEAKFSRQDNMMQHYRTHNNRKSKNFQPGPLEGTSNKKTIHGHHVHQNNYWDYRMHPDYTAPRPVEPKISMNVYNPLPYSFNF